MGIATGPTAFFLFLYCPHAADRYSDLSMAASGLGKDRSGGLREILTEVMERAMLADFVVRISLAMPRGL